MGLHNQIWAPFWRELTNCAALVEARNWDDESPIALMDNLMAYGASQYDEEEFFCGTYMRNYCSREFWSGTRWERPINRGPLTAMEPLFEWYGGGCSNPTQCRAYNMLDNPLHGEEPDGYSLLSYRLGATFWDLWHDGPEGLYNKREFRDAETVPIEGRDLLTDNQRLWLDINAASVQANKEFWQERNPKCPISPTWSSEPVELEVIYSMLSQHTLML